MSLCSDHPRYQAKRKPRAACEACWKAWLDGAVDREIAAGKKRTGMCSCGHSFDRQHGKWGCFAKEGRNGCDDSYCDCQMRGPA